MFTKTILFVLTTFLAVCTLVVGEDTYNPPEFKLDKRKGQTIVIKSDAWETNYQLENNHERQIASKKDKYYKVEKNEENKENIERSPSSKKLKPNMYYWKYSKLH